MSSSEDVLAGVCIRPFTMDDYDAVVALWDLCGLPYKPLGRDSRESIRREMSGDIALFLVAEKGKQIIGTVLGTHDGRKGWINRLAVAPSMRRGGLAKELLEQAENEIFKKGIDIIACLIAEGNETSMKFFEKSGYIHHPDVFYYTRRKHAGV